MIVELAAIGGKAGAVLETIHNSWPSGTPLGELEFKNTKTNREKLSEVTGINFDSMERYIATIIKHGFLVKQGKRGIYAMPPMIFMALYKLKKCREQST